MKAHVRSRLAGGRQRSMNEKEKSTRGFIMRWEFPRTKLLLKRYKREVAKVKQNMSPNSRILDVGCGHGFTDILLSKEGFDVIAIDIYEHEVWKEIPCFHVKASGTDMPFRNSTFDAVVACGTLEHIDEKDAFIKESHRVLKEGGILFLYRIPNSNSFNEMVTRLLKYIVPTVEGECYGHECLLRKDEVKKLCTRWKFKIIELKTQSLISSQPGLFSVSMHRLWESVPRLLDCLDRFLLKTPLSLFCQDFELVAEAEK